MVTNKLNNTSCYNLYNVDLWRTLFILVRVHKQFILRQIPHGEVQCPPCRVCSTALTGVKWFCFILLFQELHTHSSLKLTCLTFATQTLAVIYTCKFRGMALSLWPAPALHFICLFCKSNDLERGMRMVFLLTVLLK